MKIVYKTILIIINLIILGFAIKWYTQSSSTENNEPIIIILGQLLSLLTLIVEGISSSSVKIQNVKNKSKVTLDTKAGSKHVIKDIDDSEVNSKVH